MTKEACYASLDIAAEEEVCMDGGRPTELLDLPPELLTAIVMLIASPTDLSSIGRTCRALYAVALSGLRWKCISKLALRLPGNHIYCRFCRLHPSPGNSEASAHIRQTGSFLVDRERPESRLTVSLPTGSSASDRYPITSMLFKYGLGLTSLELSDATHRHHCVVSRRTMEEAMRQVARAGCARSLPCLTGLVLNDRWLLVPSSVELLRAIGRQLERLALFSRTVPSASSSSWDFHLVQTSDSNATAPASNTEARQKTSMLSIWYSTTRTPCFGTS